MTLCEWAAQNRAGRTSRTLDRFARNAKIVRCIAVHARYHSETLTLIPGTY
ncbi:hypothetical protein KBK07_02490 [Loktanella salsilacus]|nr:hypothetical protein KBK07_02490 [Loktanella salsilacus]